MPIHTVVVHRLHENQDRRVVAVANFRRGGLGDRLGPAFEVLVLGIGDHLGAGRAVVARSRFDQCPDELGVGEIGVPCHLPEQLLHLPLLLHRRLRKKWMMLPQ